MNWGSTSAFFAMGGYGAYVWCSVLACAVAVLAEIAGLRQRRRQALLQLRGRRPRVRQPQEVAA